jgi:NADH-quinone oxidoreductase subunit M
MFQRVVFGPVTHDENRQLSDLTGRERLVFAPLLLLIFWIGFFPQPFIDRMQPSLDAVLAVSKIRYDQGMRMAQAAPPQGPVRAVVQPPTHDAHGGGAAPDASAPPADASTPPAPGTDAGHGSHR